MDAILDLDVWPIEGAQKVYNSAVLKVNLKQK